MFVRTKEFYDKKKRGEKVISHVEYLIPRIYIVEFDTGMTVVVLATSSRDAKTKLNKDQGTYGRITSAVQEEVPRTKEMRATNANNQYIYKDRQ